MKSSSLGSEPLFQAGPLPAAPTRRGSLAAVARNTAAMLGGQILIKIFSFVFSVYVGRRGLWALFGRHGIWVYFRHAH
jgi:hypothetical protein